ncbi:MAG TPA: tetratricopeptide repeat protein [Micropepsaceae bacterium]|nr:tetratricopeptide repeat protein [Micropepsaceae bacterium]
MNFTRLNLARRIAVVTVALAAAVAAHSALAQTNPLAGPFKLLTDRSVFGPGAPQYKDLTVTFAGDVMNMVGKDASGKDVKASFDAVPDGKQHPIMGIPAYDSGIWTKVNDTTVAYKYYRGRTVVATGARIIAPDGTSLQFQENALDKNGNRTAQSLIMFDNPDARLAKLNQQQQVAAAPKPVFTPEETSALALLDKMDDEGAIQALTAIIDAPKPTPMLYYDHVSRGVAYLRKGDEAQALADFDAAVKLKPDDGDAHFRRAAIKFQHMDWQAAIDDLTPAIEANPMNADAYNMRSFAYYRLMKNDEGEADTQKACALKKDYCTN